MILSVIDIIFKEMRIKLLKLLDEISNFKWDIVFLLKKTLNLEFKTILNLNKKLVGNHEGERCFIVGNGPSLKQMNIDYLHDEIVFTVNNIMSNRSIYEKLNSDYHILIDSGYSKLNLNFKDDIITRDLLKKINYETKKPVCILNFDGKLAFDKYDLDDLDKYYLYQHRNMTESYSHKINLCANLPSSQNVIQAAIFSAISMGIKKIYLIGCDMTSIFLNFKSDSDGNVTIAEDNHAYEYTDNEKKRLLKDYNILDNEKVLHDYAKTFTIFKQIKKYCERNNIEVFNSSIGGGLDVFDRVKFSSLFESDK